MSEKRRLESVNKTPQTTKSHATIPLPDKIENCFLTFKVGRAGAITS